MKILSLVGGAKTTRELYRDYPYDELWTLSYLHQKGIHADLLFEMHLGEDIPQERLEYISSNWDSLPPIMTPDTYPLDEVAADIYGNIKIENVSARIFCDSFDYMMGLAIYERIYGRIQIFGFEMEMTAEWFYQRPSAYLMIGKASGMGIDIFVPDRSKLLMRQLYGYDGIPKIDPLVIERLTAVKEAYEAGN